MKCKVGDLAIVVRPRLDANLGMLVEVVGPWRPAENLWWVRSLSGPRPRRDGEHSHEGSVADSALCPLRGDESHESDERVEVQHVTQQLLV